MLTGLYLDLEGQPPDPKEIRERVRRRAPHLPVLRLTASPDHTRWEPAPLDLHTHVRVRRTEATYLDAASADLLRHSLPGRGAPLWDLWLLAAHDARGYRLCFRAHHGLLDVVGIAHTVAALIADEPTAGPRPHRPRRPTAAAAAHLAREAISSLRRDRHWPELTSPAAELRTWSYADTEERRLRNLAATWGGTVNDVFLATLAGAFRAWRARRDPTAPHPDLPLAMPMSVRRSGEDAAPGNHIVFARLKLPVSHDDPALAMRAVMRATARLHRTHYRDTAWPLYTIRCISPLAQAHLRRASERTLVIPSHVHLPRSFHCFGAPVRAAARLPVLARGVRCYAGLTRVADTARFAVVHDRGLAGAADLPGLWLRALADLEAVSAFPAPPTDGTGPGSQPELADCPVAGSG
jgi:hypothetical protein